MCWFYMGIAQIALDPPLLCQTGKRGKKVPHTFLAIYFWLTSATLGIVLYEFLAP